MAGFGKSPFGQTPFGGESVSASVASIAIISATQSEVIFTDPVMINGDLLDSSNYVWNHAAGAPIVTTSVVTGDLAGSGALSVIVTHSPTTFGASYTCTVNNVVDLGGQYLLTNSRSRLGSSTTFDSITLTPVASSNAVTITLSGDTFFSALNAEDLTNYDLDTDYFFPPSIDAATLVSPNSIEFSLSGVTSVEYTLTMGIATSLHYVATSLPSAQGGFEIGVGTSKIASSGLNLTGDSGYGWRFPFAVDNDTSITIPVDFSLTSAPAILSIEVNDGILRKVSVTYIGTGYIILIQSGAFNVSAIYSTISKNPSIYIEKNSLSGLFSVGLVIGGTLIPVLSTSLSNFLEPALNPDTFAFYLDAAESDLRIGGAMISTSSTLYTGSFNFIHNVPVTFIGVSDTTVNVIETKNGPLVKDWGDYTPAGIDDVAVRVNGSPYTVIGVNPYLGQIFIDPPVPKVPSGTISVEVDYQYMPDATFGMVLNVPGLGLNVFSRPFGRTTTSSTLAGNAGLDPLPHDYRVILGGGNIIQPVTKGYRFLAVESGFSAVLNDPASLMLNGGKAGSFLPPVKIRPDAYSLFADKVGDWKSQGSVSGPNIILGSQSWIFEDIDIPFDSQAAFSIRTTIAEPTTFDGVWSGAGVGFHDEKGLFLAGFLSVNGVEHLGIAQGNNLSLPVSWTLVGTKLATLTSDTIFTISTESIPALFSTGSRFQISFGPQAGIYTVTNRIDIDGTSTIVFSPAVPLPFNQWGNNPVNIIPEFRWSNRRVFLLAQTEGVNVSIVASSDFTIYDSLTIRRSLFPLFNDWTSGKVFAGNLSPFASTTQVLEVAAFQSNPIANPIITRRSAVNADLADLHSQGWFFRHQESLNEGVKSECLRFDPAFSDGSVITVDIDFTTLNEGWESFKILELHDRNRKVEVHALAYDEGATRELVSTRRTFLSPRNQLLWSGSLDPQIRSDLLVFDKTGTGYFLSFLTGGNRTSYERNIRFKARGSAQDSFEVFIESRTPNVHDVSVILGVGQVSLGSLGAIVASFPYAWDDGEFHIFHVKILFTQVFLFVDGNLLGTEPLGSFTLTTPQLVPITGIRLITSNPAFIELAWLNAWESIPSTALRTFAFKVADTGNFDEDYILPVNAPSSLSNSDVLKPVVSTFNGAVRLHFDPAYGAVLELPTVTPPSFTPAFATQHTNPSRGFCNIEYRNLSYDPVPAGFIMFATGSPVIDIHTMEYQILQRPLQDYQITRSMVLNRANILHSGEFVFDTTPEVVAVEPINSTQISLRGVDYNAALVYQVVDEGNVRVDFTFDKSTQVITMDSPLAGIPLVYFIPDKPITSTYLRNQPDSATTLFERTPPFVWSHTKRLANILLYGVDYDGNASPIPSDTGTNPLVVKSGTLESLYDGSQVITVQDSGVFGVMTIAQDSLIEFNLTILP